MFGLEISVGAHLPVKSPSMPYKRAKHSTDRRTQRGTGPISLIRPAFCAQLRRLTFFLLVAACCLDSPRGSAQTPPPAGAQAWFQKGQVALQDNDLSSAEAAFRQVLVLDPKAGAAYANLGVIAMRQRKWDEALQNVHKAEKLSPKMTGIRLNIGLVEFRQGNYREPGAEAGTQLVVVRGLIQPSNTVARCTQHQQPGRRAQRDRNHNNW